ncbi:hypothetical protein N9C56_10855 [Paracoccaceae bacterium]|nr:hypothetical protein [Paracoccaceae bacterium]
MQKSIKSIRLCLILIILGCTSAFSQTNENEKISSVMDDKISQLNTALTRIIDRQENLRTSVTEFEEKLTLFSDRVDNQETEISTNLLGEIEALKAETATEMSAMQESLAVINDLKTAIVDIRSTSEANETKFKDALKGIESEVAILNEFMLERIWVDKFVILKDEQGFAKLLSRTDLTRVSVTIPDQENCLEMGDWLVLNAPMRDVNRFFVKVDNDFATCKLINAAWSIVPVNSSQKSHIVYVKN